MPSFSKSCPVYGFKTDFSALLLLSAFRYNAFRSESQINNYFVAVILLSFY